MKTLRLLNRDMRNGVIAKWYLFLVPILFSFIQSYQFHLFLENQSERNALITKGTIADYIMFVMKGTTVFNFDPKEYFFIPVYWFVFQIGLAYFVSYYAYDDVVANGVELLVAVKNKRYLWLSKFLWCLLTVITYFAVCMLMVCVAAGLWGADVHFEPTISLRVTIYPISAVGLNTGSIWLTVVILPMLISLAMCLGQIFLEFLLTPAISFGIICLVYIISAYYTKWYFVGNYTMWQRSSYIADNGLNPMSGIVLAACIILLTLIGGTIYFDNKDII